NVLISAEDGRIKLSATDLETSITTYVGGSVEEPGAVTIPARLLREFISNLPPSTIEATLKNNILSMTSDRTKVKFNGIDATDFPDISEFPKKVPYLALDPSVFGDIISSVVFAAATDAARPIFSGVLVNYSNETLTLVATDGFRLSERVISLVGEVAEFSAVISARTIFDVAKIFGGSNEPLKFALMPDINKVIFQSEDTTVSTGILNDPYPDYKRIIPSEFILSAEVSASELLEAVKLASVFAQDNIQISFDPKGTISISSSEKESGENSSKFDAIVEGEKLEVNFNARYLLDFLNNVKAERIIIKTQGSTSPCLIIPIESTGFLHLMMPIRV
ncbi:MAG: DNA polymerase III subunit beta, partial [Patescibacteria group bacterium]